MTIDDLSAPLGLNRTRKLHPAPAATVSRIVIGFLSLFIAVFAGWAIFANVPFAGPVAVARPEPDTAHIAKLPAAETTAAIPVTPESPARTESLSPAAPLPSAPARRTITIIDGTSGKSQEVVIPESSAAPAEEPEPPSDAKPLRTVSGKPKSAPAR